MKLFVTGGTGFLGREVVAALVARGHDVRAMVRRADARLPSGVAPMRVSFDDASALAECLRGSDAIVHMAGKVSRDPADSAAMHALHVEATQKLLTAAVGAGVRRFVLASTSGTIAVSKDDPRPKTERDEPSLGVIGRWPYYMSKRLEEREVLLRHEKKELEAVVLNPSLLLGPGDDRLSSTRDVLDVLNRRIPAVPDGTVAFVDVRDCAPAFVAALERGVSGERYLLNGANMSVQRFFERIALAGGVAAPRLRLPNRVALAGARFLEGFFHTMDRVPEIQASAVDMACHHWACDASLAKSTLGFVARDPQTTVRDTVQHLERTGAFRRPV